MSLLRSFWIAWKGLWSYKSRSLLAILGMAISSLLVVFLLSLLHNFKESLIGQVQSVGVQQIVAVPGKLLNNRAMDTDLSGMMSFTSVSSTLTAEDAAEVKKQVSSVVAVAPQIETITTVTQEKKHADTIYTGTSYQYPEIFTLEMEEGRFFSQQEEKEEDLVIVLGHTAKSLLFGESKAVGKQVRIKGLDFTVIGVLKEKKLIGFNFDERVYTSYKVASDTANLKHASMLFFKSQTAETIADTEKKIDRVIVKNHGTKDFNLLKPDEALHIIDTVMTLVTAITIGITGVSFIVGGIGIMNVMLLTVRERTREIGIRKSVGAKSWHIMCQFLLEATYISLLGCFVGLAGTYASLQILHHFFPILRADLPVPILGITILFSILLGILFGIVPAWKAVRVKPIDALRYE